MKRDEKCRPSFIRLLFCIIFKNIGKVKIITLINTSSKIKVINPAYAAKLGFQKQKTNVSAEKIDCSSIKIYGIIVFFLDFW